MIIKLNEQTIKRIAAGEVIQKISNAVKEIIENAIDAKSTEIKIYCQNYGFSEIKIIDNGTGIQKEDLSLTTSLHTTSKTNNNDELFGINSLGFRGEALASIDIISELTIESNNYCWKNKIISASNIEHGTTITIKNIFKNLPVRMKYLNPINEFKYIKEIIKKYITNHENIAWTFIHNNRIIWDYSISNKDERIEKIFKEKPLFYEKNTQHCKISVYILKKNYNFNIIFVNNRPIKDKVIEKYIRSLFKEYTFINENPGYILFIEIEHIYVDYNIHPSKEEIKFFNYKEILDCIYDIFSMQNLVNPLNNIDHIIHPKMTNIIDSTSIKNDSNDFSVFSKFNNDNNKLIKENTDFDFKINEKILFDENKKTLEYEKSEARIIGQFQDSFILFEKNNELGIFDQHAAHERKIYEEMKHEMNNTESQILLQPIILKLNIEQEKYLKKCNTDLEKYKIIIKNNKIISIPLFYKNLNLNEFFEDLNPPYDFSTEFLRLLANIACKQAIKANQTLNIHEMQQLLEQSLYNIPVCNHGRPAFKYFTRKDIEKLFKR